MGRGGDTGNAVHSDFQFNEFWVLLVKHIYLQRRLVW